MAHCDNATLILGIAKASCNLKKEVSLFVLCRARITWRQTGMEKRLGRVQVTMNESNGTLYLSPQKAFHDPKFFNFQLFDLIDDD